MFRYEAVDGSRFTNRDAQIIGPVLAGIAERHDGMILPQTVVDEAKPKGSPLHPYIFVENDKEAANQWRLHRAQTMTRSIKITVAPRDESEEPLSERAFIHIPAVPNGERSVRAYVPLADALDRFWDQAIEDVERSVRALSAKLHRYERMDGFRERFGILITAVDSVVAPQRQIVAPAARDRFFAHPPPIAVEAHPQGED